MEDLQDQNQPNTTVVEMRQVTACHSCANGRHFPSVSIIVASPFKQQSMPETWATRIGPWQISLAPNVGLGGSGSECRLVPPVPPLPPLQVTIAKINVTTMTAMDLRLPSPSPPSFAPPSHARENQREDHDCDGSEASSGSARLPLKNGSRRWENVNVAVWATYTISRSPMRGRVRHVSLGN